MISNGPAAGLRIDATGRNVGYTLGTSDPDEQQWLCRHVSRGDVLFDIGANIGFFTLLGGKLVGAEGAVIAFEPLPDNLTQLHKNIALNGFDQVTVVAAAVSNEPGTASFATPLGRRDTARLVRLQDDDNPRIEVDVVTIDQWLNHTPDRRPPNVLKIDVEGSEIDVLRGAKNTLEAMRPTIMVEVHWLGRDFTRYVEQELAPLGYVARQLDGHDLPIDPVRYHAEIVHRSCLVLPV